ncbi:hypothetical protein [Actinocorallia aurea]
MISTGGRAFMSGVRGVLLVAGSDVRSRVRTRRWRRLLLGWAVFMGLAAAAAWWGFAGREGAGVGVFGTLMCVVLVGTLLIAPLGTARPGDRVDTPSLTPAENALGELLAAWGAGLVVLAVAVPFAASPVFTGDVGAPAALVALSVTALLIGVVCTVSQALPGAAASCLAVLGLLFGTVVGYSSVSTLGPGENERRGWWVLTASPLVVVADATPRLSSSLYCYPPGKFDEPLCQREMAPFDVLGEVGEWARDRVSDGHRSYEPFVRGQEPPRPGPVWPYGFGFHLVLAAAAVAVTIRRARRSAKAVEPGVPAP